MQLIIDIGNSKIKIGVFENKEIHPVLAFNHQSLDQTEKVLNQYSWDAAMFVSVAAPQDALQALIAKYVSPEKTIYLSHTTPLPITNGYATPETLGKDRLCSAVAASVIFPNENCLVIDCGTCMKYDFINAEKKYLGGSISLGLNMRFKALNHFTNRLPLLSFSEVPPHLIGNDTTGSIQTGVVSAMIHEMQGFISQYDTFYPNLKIILSGGDKSKFVNSFKNRIFAVENIVLIGAHQILQHNA